MVLKQYGCNELKTTSHQINRCYVLYPIVHCQKHEKRGRGMLKKKKKKRVSANI